MSRLSKKTLYNLKNMSYPGCISLYISGRRGQVSLLNVSIPRKQCENTATTCGGAVVRFNVIIFQALIMIEIDRKIVIRSLRLTKPFFRILKLVVKHRLTYRIFKV